MILIFTCYDANKHQGITRQERLLLPLMFPMAASAVSSCLAAVLLANVSGILVPNATNVIPVTLL